MSTETQDSTRLYEALQLNAPVVLINRIEEGWPCDQVSSDNTDGGRKVAEYLVKAARRRIGLIGGPTVARTIRDRQDAFRATLKALGQPLEDALSIQVDEFTHKTGFEAALWLFDLADPPDAIFCVNDVIALGARDAARMRRIDVPDALWIVGYDDIEMASWYGFDLTTIRQPLSHMAEIAVDLLLARI
jgi:LacI family transcriptional regulator